MSFLPNPRHFLQSSALMSLHVGHSTLPTPLHSGHCFTSGGRRVERLPVLCVFSMIHPSLQSLRGQLITPLPRHLRHGLGSRPDHPHFMHGGSVLGSGCVRSQTVRHPCPRPHTGQGSSLMSQWERSSILPTYCPTSGGLILREPFPSQTGHFKRVLTAASLIGSDAAFSSPPPAPSPNAPPASKAHTDTLSNIFFIPRIIPHFDQISGARFSSLPQSQIPHVAAQWRRCADRE